MLLRTLFFFFFPSFSSVQGITCRGDRASSAGCWDAPALVGDLWAPPHYLYLQTKANFSSLLMQDTMDGWSFPSVCQKYFLPNFHPH